MASLGRIAVLYNELPDGASKDDLDILPQVEAVSRTLDQMGFDVHNLAFSLGAGFCTTLLGLSPDLVFNLVETVFSENRWAYLAPALLERLGLPYTGCSAASMNLTTDKIAAKKELARLGIPTPEWVTASEADGLVPHSTYIVKAVYEDASIGLTGESVRSFAGAGELETVLETMQAQSGREFFAERFIDGREINISLLGDGGKPQMLTPSEVCFPGYDEKRLVKILDYDAKWEPTSFGYQTIFSIPCCRSEDSALLAEMQAICETCWSSFGLKSYARIDFRVDKQGKPYVLEINTNPCITPGEGGFVKSAKESGLDFHDVISRIVRETWDPGRPLLQTERRRVV